MGDPVFLNPVHYVGGTTDVCYDSDGSHLITCGQDGYVHIFKTNGGPVLDIHCSNQCFRIVQYHERLFVATNKNELEVRLFPEGYAVDSLIRFDAPASALCLSKSCLFVGTRNSKVVMIDLHDTNNMKNFDPHQGSIIDLSATASTDRRVRIFDIKNQKLIKQLNILRNLNEIEKTSSPIKIDWDTSSHILAVPIGNSVCFYGDNMWIRKHKYTNVLIKELINLVCYSPCKLFFIIAFLNGQLCLINRISYHIYMTYSTNNSICSIVWNPVEESKLSFTTNNGQIGHIDVLSFIDNNKLKSLNTLLAINADQIKKKSDYLVVFVLYLLQNYHFIKTDSNIEKLDNVVAKDFVGYVLEYKVESDQSNKIVIEMFDAGTKFNLRMNFKQKEYPILLSIDDCVHENEGHFHYNNLMKVSETFVQTFEEVFDLLEERKQSAKVIDQENTINAAEESNSLLEFDDDASDDGRVRLDTPSGIDHDKHSKEHFI